MNTPYVLLNMNSFNVLLLTKDLCIYSQVRIAFCVLCIYRACKQDYVIGFVTKVYEVGRGGEIPQYFMKGDRTL